MAMSERVTIETRASPRCLAKRKSHLWKVLSRSELCEVTASAWGTGAWLCALGLSERWAMAYTRNCALLKMQAAVSTLASYRCQARLRSQCSSPTVQSVPSRVQRRRAAAPTITATARLHQEHALYQ